MAGRRRLLLAPSVAADLDSIYLHLSENSPAAARGQVERIVKSAKGLCDFPDMGRSRDRLAPDLRSVVKDNYVILYVPQDDRIEIVRILHGRRDIENEMLSFIERNMPS